MSDSESQLVRANSSFATIRQRRQEIRQLLIETQAQLTEIEQETIPTMRKNKDPYDRQYHFAVLDILPETQEQVHIWLQKMDKLPPSASPRERVYMETAAQTLTGLNHETKRS